jgi:hypothetical protein
MSMHPFEVSNSLFAYGFWFTYWRLRNEYTYTRWESLWLIWIGWSYQRHMDKLHEDVMFDK